MLKYSIMIMSKNTNLTAGCREGGIMFENKSTEIPVTKKLLSATDICEILGVSRSTAYRIIKRLNDQLEKKGKITVSGKISARYFYENVYL